MQLTKHFINGDVNIKRDFGNSDDKQDKQNIFDVDSILEILSKDQRQLMKVNKHEIIKMIAKVMANSKHDQKLKTHEQKAKIIDIT